MGPGRKTALVALLAGAAAAGAPSAANADTACEFPKAWNIAYADLIYEVSLFSGQTAYDAQYLGSSTLVPFTQKTLKRTLAMSASTADIGEALVLASVASPPDC